MSSIDNRMLKLHIILNKLKTNIITLCIDTYSKYLTHIGKNCILSFYNTKSYKYYNI